MERPRRYCTNCGSQVSPQDAFCGVCGTRLAPGAHDTSPTRDMDIPGPMRQQAGGYTLPGFLRFPEPGRDALLGLGFALACATLLVAVLYILLALRGTFSDPPTPGTIGLALFALIHGGAASVDVPPMASLFGLGGSLRLGLPVTSLALLPFVASLLAARFLGPRVRTPALFMLVAALSYALVVAVLAALGSASSESGEVTVRFSADPLSTALRAFLWVGLGTMIGVGASRGPLLPARVRQVLRGALWAVGVSLAVTLVLAVVIALVQQAVGGDPPPTAPAAPAPEGLPQPELGGASVRGILATIGAIFMTLPIAFGNLWLLAHGVPVGFQNAPDLGSVPLVGQALADVPLRVALLSHWPWGFAWRLLVLGPVAGFVVGGMVAARGSPPETRWQQAALVALPYTIITLLTAILVGASADLTLAEAAKVEFAFRASLAWLLLLLPVGAALGAAGAFLTRGSDAFPAAHPHRAFLATSIVSGILVLASLPALAGPGGGTPASSLASEGLPLGDQYSSEEALEETPPPESSPPPEEDTSPEPAPADSEADSAFDRILTTLRQRTSAPIMLPTELPDELENVAVDADQKGERYGVLFLFEPSGNVLESYVHANDAGTLTAAPEPPDTTDDVFEATKEESVELPDGTEATLKYMEPTQVVNQGPFWEGAFEREGYTYTLRVPLDDPSGDMARQVLSSMVEIPDEASPGGGTELAKEGSQEDGPASGYNLIQTPDGSLSVEVPPSWGVETGEDSEKEAGPNTWSYQSGEYLNSSITTAPNLDAWYATGTTGTYMVASRSLTQYSDYELTHSLLYANKSENCTKGPYKDYDRPPYSGKIQTWYECGVDGATTYSVAAAPEGRECVVVFDARISEEADREAIEHLINSFEVDCGRVTSEPLATPSASASASPSASAPAGSASAEAQTGNCSDPAYQAQNPGVCGTVGYNPVSDPGDNYSQGVVVGDDTPDCTRPEDVLESGLCRSP